MLENKIIQIIYAELKDYLKIDDIKAFPTSGSVKYIFDISEYCFEVSYEVIDNFYRIKMEKKQYNQIQNVIFITKSKKFKKDIKLILRELKLPGNAFQNHIIAFCVYIRKILGEYKHLNCFEQMYNISNLKFDGIFI